MQTKVSVKYPNQLAPVLFKRGDLVKAKETGFIVLVSRVENISGHFSGVVLTNDSNDWITGDTGVNFDYNKFTLLPLGTEIKLTVTEEELI